MRSQPLNKIRRVILQLIFSPLKHKPHFLLWKLDLAQFIEKLMSQRVQSSNANFRIVGEESVEEITLRVLYYVTEWQHLNVGEFVV